MLLILSEVKNRPDGCRTTFVNLVLSFFFGLSDFDGITSVLSTCSLGCILNMPEYVGQPVVATGRAKNATRAVSMVIFRRICTFFSRLEM